MPKSYKITEVEHFRVSDITQSPTRLTRQGYLPGTVPGPQTTIVRTSLEAGFEDFAPYRIDHERPVNMRGRLYENGEHFSSFIGQGTINGFYSTGKGLLLLNGKKADVLDFCRRTADISEIDLRLLSVDMDRLQERLAEVNGVWFRCKRGLIRAKGFMGSHIQNTQEFKKAKTEGDISTLSFYFDATDGSPHPVMVTEDGAIVLQGIYDKVEAELEIVMSLKTCLLDGVTESTEVGKSRRAAVSVHPGED